MNLGVVTLAAGSRPGRPPQPMMQLSPVRGYLSVMPDVERLSYPMPDGSLSVLAAGPAEAPPIVLLHGIPANAGLFAAVLPLLGGAGYRAIAPDMPGYGQTRVGPGSDYSLPGVAERYAAWLVRERLAPVWLVGHDIGAAVAQLMAVRHGETLSRLTLSNGPLGRSFPVPAVHLAIFAARTGLLRPLVRLGLVPNPYMSGEVRRGFDDAQKLTPEIWRDVFWDAKVRTDDGVRAFANHLRALRNDALVEIAPQLKDISVPTLLLWSERDRHQPAQTTGARLRAALPPSAAYEELPGAGHFAPLEAPDAYAARLLAWAAGGAPSASAAD